MCAGISRIDERSRRAALGLGGRSSDSSSGGTSALGLQAFTGPASAVDNADSRLLNTGTGRSRDAHIQRMKFFVVFAVGESEVVGPMGWPNA